MRVLVIQLRHMGDALLVTPALRALRSRFPSARLDYLVRSSSASAVEGNPHIDEVLIWRRGFMDHLRLLGTLRRRRYDAVIDLHSTQRTAILVAATGAKRRIGNRTGMHWGALYTDMVPGLALPEYAAVHALRHLGPLGMAETALRDLRLEVAIGHEEREWADRVWNELGLTGERSVVVVSPVSKLAFKQWGADRWAAVADALQGAGHRVLLTHGPDERDQVEAVAARMRTQPAWGHRPTTIKQLAALYERCVLWVGNDGGAKHVAAAAGTATVAVHRWTTGAQFTDTSPGSPHRYVERAPSQGCDRVCSACSHQACLVELPVGDVLTSIREVLPAADPAHGS